MKIGILDYNACNISSIYYSIYRLGYDPKIIKNSNELQDIDRLIIPGVGAAKSCIDHLNQTGLFNEIQEFLATQKPILGICMGFQIFATKLYEHGLSKGIGLIEGEIVPFKKPNLFNIGWQDVEINKKSEIFKDIKNNNSFYFCHSHYLKFNNKKDEEESVGTIKFGTLIPSLIIKENFMGTQFHPEKSQKNGLNLIKYFLNWSPQ